MWPGFCKWSFSFPFAWLGCGFLLDGFTLLPVWVAQSHCLYFCPYQYTLVEKKKKERKVCGEKWILDIYAYIERDLLQYIHFESNHNKPYVKWLHINFRRKRKHFTLIFTLDFFFQFCIVISPSHWSIFDSLFSKVAKVYILKKGERTQRLPILL